MIVFNYAKNERFCCMGKSRITKNLKTILRYMGGRGRRNKIAHYKGFEDSFRIKGGGRGGDFAIVSGR